VPLGEAGENEDDENLLANLDDTRDKNALSLFDEGARPVDR
jgi:hypothetical protein